MKKYPEKPNADAVDPRFEVRFYSDQGLIIKKPEHMVVLEDPEWKHRIDLYRVRIPSRPNLDLGPYLLLWAVQFSALAYFAWKIFR